MFGPVWLVYWHAMVAIISKVTGMTTDQIFLKRQLAYDSPKRNSIKIIYWPCEQCRHVMQKWLTVVAFITWIFQKCESVNAKVRLSITYPIKFYNTNMSNNGSTSVERQQRNITELTADPGLWILNEISMTVNIEETHRNRIINRPTRSYVARNPRATNAPVTLND